MTTGGITLEESRKKTQELGERFAELYDVRDEREFLTKGAVLMRDSYQLGFENGKNAGRNEGFDEAMKEVNKKVDKFIERVNEEK